MRNKKRNEKRPPKIWDLPFGIRRQLGGRSGRQLALEDDGHLMIVLFQVPQTKSNPGEKVFYWRNRDQQWHYSERGGGFSSLESLVQAYDDRVAELEELLENADDSEARFKVLDEATPVLRSARNLCDALQKAHELSEQMAESNVRRPQEAQRDLRRPLDDGQSDKTEKDPEVSKLHGVFEHASEIARAAEVLKSDIESAIQFAHARQQEIQSHYVRQQSRAAHRLNILAATFLPVATISSVFGMNLASGFEGSHLLFWLILFASIMVGAWVGYSVMNVRQLNPTDW